ncbi:MAG: PRC-barrel domain-containing protein [Bacillota bacterium]
MFYKGKEIKKYDIRAKDGNIGTVHDLLIDEKQWTTRYLVVDTRKWLPGKKVLISPMSILTVNDLEGCIELNLTQEEIKNSPGLDEDQSISRQYELDFGNYYGYAPYWTAENGLWGLYSSPSELVQNTHENVSVQVDTNEESHLRSLEEVSGYHIHAKDGRIGHAEDFIICDRTWAVRSVEVDTKNFWPGKHVLFSPEWITDISWMERAVYLGLTKENIENGPESLPRDEIPYVSK